LVYLDLHRSHCDQHLVVSRKSLGIQIVLTLCRCCTEMVDVDIGMATVIPAKYQAVVRHPRKSSQFYVEIDLFEVLRQAERAMTFFLVLLLALLLVAFVLSLQPNRLLTSIQMCGFFQEFGG